MSDQRRAFTMACLEALLAPESSSERQLESWKLMNILLDQAVADPSVSPEERAAAPGAIRLDAFSI